MTDTTSATSPRAPSNPLSTWFATCPRGLETLLADELTSLGAEVTGTTVAGVHFNGSQETAYRTILWSRLANRIIRLLTRVGGVDTGEQLRKASAGVDWAMELPDRASIAVDFHGTWKDIRHTFFGAQTVKDGIVEAMFEEGRHKPTVDGKNADLRIYAHLHNGFITLGIDLVGRSLHQRGYRPDLAHAPLKENLAAALLMRADWPARAARGESLVDPMCGSGTLLIEAALMAADIAPQSLNEDFACRHWGRHDERIWKGLREEMEQRAIAGRRKVTARLFGRDHSPQAISAARSNAMRAGIPALIELEGASVAELTCPEGATTGLVMTNPPYGERLGELPALVPLYASLGERMKRHFGGWTLGMFTGNPDLGHRLGLRAHRQYAFRNGQLDCKLLMIDVAARERAVDEDSVAEDARSQPALSEGGQMFANRLKKNQKTLSRWLKQSGTTCYRLYDADMPEYALAIDIYGRHVHVQEYTPPKSVDASQAQRRLMDALAAIPQVLGCSPNDIHIKQRTRQAGKAQYTRQDSSGQRIEVQEGDARLWVNLKDYLDTGLFLDHRPVRKLLGKEADGKRVLNLFCYTATATVHAVLGGASESVSVDMSNTYLDWGRENFKLNGISEKRHQLVRADCLKWLERSREEFDLIFLDPPTFSNSKKMEGTLDIQRDHARLIDLAMASLAPGGTLIFSNNHRRFVMDDSVSLHHVVEDLSRKLLDPDFKRRPDIHHVFRIRRASDVKG